MDLRLLGAQHGPAAGRLHAPHLGIRGGIAIAGAVAMRHLVEAVLRDLGADLHRLEQDVVAWIARHDGTFYSGLGDEAGNAALVDGDPAMFLELDQRARPARLPQRGDAEAQRPVRAFERHDLQRLAVQRGGIARPGVEQGVAVFVRDHGADDVGMRGARRDLRRQSFLEEQRQEIFAAQRQVEQDHRLRREIVQRQRTPLRQPVLRPQQRIGRQLGQRLERHILRHLQIIGQQDVDLAAPQPVDQVLLVAFVDRDQDGGKALLKGVAQFRQDDRRQGHQAPDIERPARLLRSDRAPRHGAHPPAPATPSPRAASAGRLPSATGPARDGG